MNNSLSMQLIGEFLGTAMLVLLGDGVCAGTNLNKSKSKGAGWIVIAFGWGFAVAFSVYSARWLCLGHYNPAVTFSMAIAHKLPWSSVLPYFVVQVLGAFVGAILVWLTYYPHWKETDDQEAILGSFATVPAIRSYAWNFFTEAIATFVLVYGLLALTNGDLAAGLNPLLAGFLITSVCLSLGGPTGVALNPARDFGPRLAHQLLPIANKGQSDWAYSWVPVVAPLVGGALAASLFNVLA
ncbi:glycerol uptake facilitator protein [Lactobacillus apis]|uniref:MIP/aquaporin family protein n=1 Tax=Lactobacillus apis TaxID=303541 RepID=UPI00081627E8|nr:MIP/aquaporin family protein [Lactobacillus apis]GGG31934.1 glycerol uptake facilitator protein [Lactobacillus apis]SCB75834.1 glycerol uptake facilitator protein [Lactobacillus apis]